MSGLAHYIEREGVATVCISLIREHSEKMKPPRTLWVPFPLGRPFGPPGHAGFQTDVLRTALDLLRRESGPVLEDYPFDSPSVEEDAEEGWSCVLPLPPVPEAATDAERLTNALLMEISLLRPWYEEALRKRGRTAFGLSGLTPDSVENAGRFLAAIAAGADPEPPPGTKDALPAVIRYIADDVKAFYTEAATAQPGAGVPSPKELNDWLYGRTRLADVLYAIRDRFAAAENPRPIALIPVAYRTRPPATD